MQAAVAKLVTQGSVAAPVETRKRVRDTASEEEEREDGGEDLNSVGEIEPEIWNRAKRTATAGAISDREFLAAARKYVTIMEEMTQLC